MSAAAIRSAAMDLETQSIAARMIEDKIRDEYIKVSGIANCGAVVNYREDADEWEARPARVDLTPNEKRGFVTAVNRVIHKHKIAIKVILPHRGM
jgi:hypothetical protein